MSGVARFVQFPHPGGEHNPPPDGHMGWNRGMHKRKFLVANASYLDEEGRTHRDEVAFWGEWEPPSVIEQTWSAAGRLPRALHRPYWFVPDGAWQRQNTDPWVFGPTMIYSNCKQIHTTSLRRLPEGSVICFGSTIAGAFCLDTVMVVASPESWSPRESDGLDLEEAFIACTGASLAANPEAADFEFTLYRGARPDAPADGGTFSFVPARATSDSDYRFARPSIELPGLINPRSKQATKGSNDPISMNRVAEAWEEIRRQVLDAGLVLAFDIEVPRQQGPPDGDHGGVDHRAGSGGGRSGPSC